MAKFAAFLRGVNLGKSRRVKNEQLRAAFEGLGFAAVSTFRASGNLIFEAGGGTDPQARLEAGLATELGFQVSVFLRSARQLSRIAAQEPFEPAQIEASKGKLQIALLAGPPSSVGRRKALALAGEADLLAIRAAELYWLPSAGTLQSELDLKVLEALLGPWTMRTMGTIEQLAAKLKT